jgi:hypothetical protein
MKKIIILFSSLAFIASCGNEKGTEEVVSVNITHEGKKLMELNCNACHSPSAGENARIAPPMIAVKKQYLEKGTSKEDFIASIQKWVENPSEYISKMPGAVRKFGLMPKAEYSKETIEKIADYLFTNELEKPEWFDEHYKKQHGKKGKKMKGKGALSYADIGMKYALSTKSQLGKNLMGAIQSKGIENAVTFCNVRAMPITDSMSTENNARIKRVSDKPRNPNNRANTVELAHILTFKNQLTNKEHIKPIVEEEGDRVNFYFPITTNAMCLQCHGTLEQELKLSTYDKIKALYPDDEAIGYEENQVRGIWSIEFDK